MELFTCKVCNKRFSNIKKLECHAVHHRKDYYNPSTERRKNSAKLLQKEYEKNPLRCFLCKVAIDYKKSIKKKHDMIKNKSNRVFCGSSCAATYNNTHKTHGNNRSKLEKYLATELIKVYPTVEFQFNQKNTINSELDIYVPLLKLAFELNGIYHYEPIHGIEKLTQIQNNDKRKFQACLEKGIELCIIDSSKLSYFKESNALLYLKIIIEIINQKIKAEAIDTSKLPVVVYDPDFDRYTNELKKIKCCKHCNKEFIYSRTPKQTFCTNECKKIYRKKNSYIYNQLLQHKEKIKMGIAKNLPMNAIASSIGFNKCTGGYYYAIKSTIDEIKAENFNNKLLS